jgi:hypothetical protein
VNKESRGREEREELERDQEKWEQMLCFLQVIAKKMEDAHAKLTLMNLIPSANQGNSGGGGLILNNKFS